jgi:hypothetical protein
MGHGEPNNELVSTYEKQICQCFDYYESLLAKQTYLAGNVSLLKEEKYKVTGTDTCMATGLHYDRYFPPSLDCISGKARPVARN